MAQTSPWISQRALAASSGSAGQPAADGNNYQRNDSNNNQRNNKQRNDRTRNQRRGGPQTQSHWKTQRQLNHINDDWQAFQAYAAAAG